MATWTEGAWLNEPAEWQRSDAVLTVTTDARTDFWRDTHYGFRRDMGHVFGREIAGDFTAQLRIEADYSTLYDQAGLMVRIDERRWLKAGIEWSDGMAMLSSVLTDERSDWATAPYGQAASPLWLRVTVSEGVVRVQSSPDGHVWPLCRLAPFPRSDRYSVGPMCCTPERAGLRVRFSEFRVGPPLGKDLHDLS